MGKARAPDLPGYLLQCGTNPFQLCRIEVQPDRVSGSVSLIELDCAVIKHGEALIDIDWTADDAVPDKYSSGTAWLFGSPRLDVLPRHRNASIHWSHRWGNPWRAPKAV